MHNPREKDENPEERERERERERLKEEMVHDFCMDTKGLLFNYYKHYLLFRAVIIECSILYHLSCIKYTDYEKMRNIHNFESYTVFIYHSVMDNIYM